MLIFKQKISVKCLVPVHELGDYPTYFQIALFVPNCNMRV